MHLKEEGKRAKGFSSEGERRNLLSFFLECQPLLRRVFQGKKRRRRYVGLHLSSDRGKTALILERPSKKKGFLLQEEGKKFSGEKRGGGRSHFLT